MWYASFKRSIAFCFGISSNDNFNFDTPTINSPAIYLSTTGDFESEFNDIALNGEFILIDSDHDAIIREDVHKIVKYFK